MEVLVQWFTDNLSQHISKELIIFIISMIPILELRGWASGCITSESISSKSHPNLYYGKYYSDSVYSALYPSDF